MCSSLQSGVKVPLFGTVDLATSAAAPIPWTLVFLHLLQEIELKHEPPEPTAHDKLLLLRRDDLIRCLGVRLTSLRRRLTKQRQQQQQQQQLGRS